MKVNIEAGKISVLREQIFCRRIRSIRKERVGIDGSPDLNEFLDKFNHSPRAEPACHSAGDLVTDQIPKDCRMSRMRPHGSADIFNYLFPYRPLTQKLDVLFPWKGHQHAQTRRSATIKKPARRRMVNPDNVQTGLAH